MRSLNVRAEECAGLIFVMTNFFQFLHDLSSWIHQNQSDALIYVIAALALATFAVALYTAMLARETKKLRKSADDTAVEQILNNRRAADATEQSAFAAQISANSTKRLVEVGQRAWVFMVELHIDAEKPELSTETKTKIKVTNLGNTPALHLRIDDLLDLYSNGIPDELVFPESETHSEHILGPGQFVYIAQNVQLNSEQLAMIRDGKWALISAGKLTYKDVTGIDRETLWCCRFSPQHQAFLAAEKHNRCT